MRYERVLLVNPPHTGFLGLGFEPNISLGYLSQALISHCVEHDIFDMALGYSESRLSRKIETYKPDLLGVTLVTMDNLDTLEMIRRIKQTHELHTIVGGPHTSCMRHELLQAWPELDYGVAMEGENALAELCSGKALSSIEGLLYRRDSEIVFNGERAHSSKLDTISFPRYEKFELQKYLRRCIGIVTSRGCPYKCTYCPVRLTSGAKIRLRSAENIFEEISYWYKTGYRDIDIWDDNFTMSSKRVHQFCDLVRQSNMKDLTLNLPNGVRADQAKRSMLQALKDAGFRKIAFGVEGGNDRILKQLKKGERMEVIEKAIENACEIGFDVILFFLIGSPYESWEDLEDSFNLARKYPIAGANFYNLIPFPKTELFTWVNEKGYLLKEPREYLSSASQLSNDPCFATPELSYADRKKAYRLANKISKLVKRDWIKRKFKGFGPLAHVVIFLYNSVYQNEILFRYFLRHRSLFRFFESSKEFLTRMIRR
ncbi:B12-binding domain-containing radical SAM protein [Acidobacteriota bacterium]